LATQNPGDELLSIGLEGNGAPIKLVRDRVSALRQFTPRKNQFGIVLPGIYSNRWDIAPTWHYVRQLNHPGTQRYSLVWGLVHPPDEPVKRTRHVRDELGIGSGNWM
jgi:hypothetical protein